MICTGTIMVVISRKYIDRLNRNCIRAKAYAASVPRVTVRTTDRPVMITLLTA